MTSRRKPIRFVLSDFLGVVIRFRQGKSKGCYVEMKKKWLKGFPLNTSPNFSLVKTTDVRKRHPLLRKKRSELFNKLNCVLCWIGFCFL